MKKRQFLSGIILFLLAAAVLSCGFNRISGFAVRSGLAERLGFAGREGKVLVRLEDGNASAAIEKNFTVPLGEEGTVLVEYVKKSGTANVSITKNGREVTELDIACQDGPAGGESGQGPGKRGELKTVLGCGVYTIKVEAGDYGGILACSLLREQTSDMP
ncbi:hypothetical protein [Clostridium transplantifaecale]|uniref:hypothetical protein n=1 Tax=Clostridium transplantifaecale TaxID=2479838 RepID=UPI000F631835|nr:hypothetical protein [Clostridium transplantifaecale]